MAKPFDATLKDMAAQDPARFVEFFAPDATGPVRLLNVDLSTVTSSADMVFGIGEPLERIVHFEPQSGPSADLPTSVLAYNVLLHRTYRVPVHSIVFLLRPEARHPAITGEIRYSATPERGGLDFRYEIVRLWEIPAELLAESHPTLIPLAVLGRLPPLVSDDATSATESTSLEVAFRRVVERIIFNIEQGTDPTTAKRLETAALVLIGLRLKRDAIQRLFDGVHNMRESVTYQAILEEGRQEGLLKGRIEGRQEGKQEGQTSGRRDEAIRLLMRLGRKRLGPMDARTQSVIEAISDVDQLETLIDRVIDVGSWSELFS